MARLDKFVFTSFVYLVKSLYIYIKKRSIKIGLKVGFVNKQEPVFIIKSC
jgi:hypothetical protein